MNAKTKKGGKVKAVALYAVYYLLLCYLYITYLSVYWTYTGYHLDYTASSIIVSAAVAILFATIAPISNDARSILLNIFVAAYIMPSLVLTALGGQSLYSSLVIWSCAIITFLVSGLKLPSVNIASVRPSAFIIVIAFLSVFLILFFYIFGGFRNFNLDITRVYDFREGAEAALPPLFGYLSATFSKLLIPLGVVSALVYRLKSAVVGFALVAILLFGFTSHKAMILYPIIAVGLYYALSKTLDFSLVLALIIIVMFVCVLDIYLLERHGAGSAWGWFTTLFLRRALFVPPLLDFYYIEFFSRYAPMYWADSRLSFGLVENPYGITAPYLVGETYFGNETGANTGFIGSGFGQARLAGSIIYAAGAGVVISLINAHANRQGVAFVTSIMAVQVLTMYTSTDFITLFLSHGVLLAFFLLGIIERPDDSWRDRYKKIERGTR